VTLLALGADASLPPMPGTRQTNSSDDDDDVLGRVVTIRRTERDLETAAARTAIPAAHTFGYVLEATYEVKVENGRCKARAGRNVLRAAGPPARGLAHASSVQPVSIWSSRSPIRPSRRRYPSKGERLKNLWSPHSWERRARPHNSRRRKPLPIEQAVHVSFPSAGGQSRWIPRAPGHARVSEELGRFLIENRRRFGATSAPNTSPRAAPDGYTLMSIPFRSCHSHMYAKLRSIR